MKRFKVLVITGALPYPLVTGAKIRTFNLLRALAKEFEIELLTVIPSSRDKVLVQKITDAGIRCHGLTRSDSRFMKIWDAMRSCFSSAPYLTRHYTYGAYRKKLINLMSDSSYDVVHCDSISMTGNLRGLDKNRLILTQHNIEQNIWAGYRDHAGGVLQKLFYGNQYRKVKSLEENLDRYYGFVVTVSENDRQMLAESFPEDKIIVVENGVDPGAYRNDTSPDKRSGVIFTGSLDWHPNIDGLEWFAEEIYPELMRIMPQCSTTVVGRRPSPAIIAALGDKVGISLYSDVPEIQPYLHSARVMMVPLRIGGGSRLKILEAFAAGIPVVSTSKGAEGLAATSGEDIIIEDNPKRFAEALVQIIQDEKLYQKLSQKGAELIEQRYAWNQVARPLADLWTKVADA
jgi:glycosyltransferase involved in cell wall biosynthesis